MPVLHEFRDGVLTVRIIGAYAPTELIGTLQTALADPRARAGVPLLLDARFSVTSVSPEELQRRVAWLGALCRDARVPRVAVLAADTPVRAQMVDQAITGLEQVGVTAGRFTAMTEALHWLRAPDAAA